MNKLNFYTIDPDYIDYITPFDQRISITYGNKAKRPYIGIVFKVYDLNYFAPFASPKPKHLNMNNTIDFFKINNGKYGAINFNNMIPIPLNNIKIVNIIKESNNKYKNLLFNQLVWCNKLENVEIILGRAKKLYDTVNLLNASNRLLERCCNFKLLEQKCIEYINMKP